MKSYRVARTPTYILVDGKGVITWVSDGPITGVNLADAVRAALKGG